MPGTEKSAAPDAPDLAPSIVFWGLLDLHFEDLDLARTRIDEFADRGAFSHLVVTMRTRERQITDADVHDAIGELARYAANRGLRVVLDVCVRLARRQYHARYPDEQQEMVILEEAEVPHAGAVHCRVEPEDLGDHMTGNRRLAYVPISGGLARAWVYRTRNGEVRPDTVRDVTSACEVETVGAEGVSVRVPEGVASEGDTVCVGASFTHLSPAVFAPHLLMFQDEILEAYRDLPLAGAAKDEWGFPPTRQRMVAHRAFWYSRFYAEAYTSATDGSDLLDDTLLMAVPHAGRHRARCRAINVYRELSLKRNAGIESHFYGGVKRAFGPEAFVAKHPTWYPHIDEREFSKNSLYWWATPRDYAQTDECTPASVCTGLAKKCGGGVWLNEHYAPAVAPYLKNVWRYVLAGGRMVYHGLYPKERTQYAEVDERTFDAAKHGDLMTPDLMQAQSRIRLLDWISAAPLDCPVAVVFGHRALMNWAEEGYEDYGEEVSLRLWQAGFPVDLIPSTEVEGGHVQVSADGYVQYGAQKYRAVVVHRPQFSRPTLAELFGDPRIRRTALFRLGGWGLDADARPYDGDARLRNVPLSATPDEVVEAVTSYLNAEDVPRQTGLSEPFGIFTDAPYTQGRRLPPCAGHCRLTDGTVIVTRAEDYTGGDPFSETIEVGRREVKVEAAGVAGIRLGESGALEALAAGGLVRLEAPGARLELDAPTDVAMWREADDWRGVYRNEDGVVPEALQRITQEWRRLG